MSTQNKNFFFTAVPNTDRFLSGDEPTQAVMKDFADSVAMKLESGDTGTETQQGLVESATQNEFDTSVDTNGLGYNLFVRPSFIKTALTTIQNLLQLQITGIQNDIVNINAAITTIQNDIVAIQGDITTLNTEITNLTTVVGDSMPIGTIIMYPVGSAPNADWVICEGQSVLTADYPDLFTVIGYTFGGGAGSMQLPDMRRKFIAGYDQLSGADYNVIGSGDGDDAPTLAGNQCGLPQHNHALGAAAQITAGSVNNGGTHNHKFDWTYIGVGGSNQTMVLLEGGGGSCDGNNCQVDGSHGHSLNTGTITFGGTTENEGPTAAAAPLDNRPAFIVFPYFIKGK